ncbi:hypothetical protein [Spirosoma pomorum]
MAFTTMNDLEQIKLVYALLYWSFVLLAVALAGLMLRLHTNDSRRVDQIESVHELLPHPTKKRH